MTYIKRSNLPVDFLPGIGQRTAKVLKSLDIRTIGQFQRTPEKVLVELFGPSIRQVIGWREKSQAQKKNLSWYQKVQVASQIMMLL